MKTGRVTLVGAGPGDPGLLTLKGLRHLRRADVVLYDRLASDALLRQAHPEAELIAVGKSPGDPLGRQEEINDILVERAKRGLRVVRLKGGDPFIFGRGREEMNACAAAGVPCHVEPGISSALAAPASIGVSLTHRGAANAFAVITGRSSRSGGPPEYDWEALAKIDAVVILMGHASLADIAAKLITGGRAADTPAVSVESATTSRQRHVTGTLANIAACVADAGLRNPIVTVVGEVARMAREEASHAGHPQRARRKPLVGRRIAVTRASSSSDELFRLLRLAGAETIACPLIRAVYPSEAGDADSALRRLRDFNWIAFTSMHGVEGFWRRLMRSGCDARSLAGLRIAAIGPATAAALHRRGLVADVTPQTFTGRDLARAILEAPHDRRSGSFARVLCPRGNLARTELESELRRVGAIAEPVEVYRTELIEPPAAAAAQLARGVDAVVFCSPSAARQYATLGLSGGEAILAALGPTTAAALTEAGLPCGLVPESADVGALVAALGERLRHEEALT